MTAKANLVKTPGKSNHPPVLWITGLAGAGKTTIADRVDMELRKHYANVVKLDGDVVRELCGNDLGYSLTDRVANAYRLSRMCHFLNQQGHIVVCSTMSLYPEIWEWNRAHIPEYREIYVKVSMETLQSRDKKGLYSKPTDATGGAPRDLHVVGRDLQFHEPLDAHLVVTNDSERDLEVNVARIIDLVANFQPESSIQDNR